MAEEGRESEVGSWVCLLFAQSDVDDQIFSLLSAVSALLVVIAALSTGYVDHCLALLSSLCVGETVINLSIFHICESAGFHVAFSTRCG